MASRPAAMDRGGLSRARQLQWLPDSCLPAESAPTCKWTGFGAAIPGRDTAEPSLGDIAVGIAFHQWANFCCAMVFLRGCRTIDRQSRPSRLAVAVVPSAIYRRPLARGTAATAIGHAKDKNLWKEP